jgi:hypothetical protein
MPTTREAFIAKIREQIEILQSEDYNYDQLLIYVSGIADPWPFERRHEFEFEDEEVLVVRIGPAEEQQNEEVPEHVFPLQHIVATQLVVS